jgi:hypothetical protein
VGLAEDISTARAAAAGFAGEGEELVGVVPTEPSPGRRVYLCAYQSGEERRWLAVDAGGLALTERRLVREAVSIAALCELAEENAGGGNLPELRARLEEIRLADNPEGIEDAEEAAAALADTIVPEPRVASSAYLDAIGAAAARLERALGDNGAPFAEAMKAGIGAAEELSNEVERGYKAALE